jgi:hypothetical protein
MAREERTVRRGNVSIVHVTAEKKAGLINTKAGGQRGWFAEADGWRSTLKMMEQKVDKRAGSSFCRRRAKGSSKEARVVNYASLSRPW